MLKQLLKEDDALLGQMFVEAPFNCGGMGRHGGCFLVLPLSVKSYKSSLLSMGQGECGTFGVLSSVQLANLNRI